MNRNTEALKQALQKKIEEKGCTGVSVCIRGSEGVLFENGFGKRSVKNDLPVLPNTVFGIASLSKSFTALTLCILHAEGVLDLDQPAADFLPDLHIPGVPDELVTLRQLALHRAGIPFNECLDWSIAMNTPGEYYQNDEYLRRTSPYQFDKIEDIIRYIGEGAYPTLGEPGEYMSYCNEAFALLSSIADKVCGKPLEDFLEERIFRPLGMTRSALDLDGSRIEAKVTDGNITNFFSDWPDGKHEDHQWTVCPPYKGCANMKSTAQDLAKYYLMLASGGVFEGKQIVPAEALDQMFGPRYPLRRKPFYAMGLRKHTVGGHMVCDHGGELHGVAAYGGFVKDVCGIAVLCNESEWDMEDVLGICYAWVLGLPLEDDYLWTHPSGKTFSRQDYLRGDYVGHLGEPVHIRVFEKDGQLQADLAGEPCKLEYCEATVFAANSFITGKRITFLRFFIQNGHAWAVKNGSLLFRRV
jgi:CubicO group peptidase (beta-lactamase class C family)